MINRNTTKVEEVKNNLSKIKYAGIETREPFNCDDEDIFCLSTSPQSFLQ